MPARCIENKLTEGIRLHDIPISFRDDRLEAKKRRIEESKRWVDFVKVKRAKLK